MYVCAVTGPEAEESGGRVMDGGGVGDSPRVAQSRGKP